MPTRIVSPPAAGAGVAAVDAVMKGEFTRAFLAQSLPPAGEREQASDPVGAPSMVQADPEPIGWEPAPGEAYAGARQP